MKDYLHDIFYRINDLSFEQRLRLIHEAYKVRTSWWIDKLDCTVDMRRQRQRGIRFRSALSKLLLNPNALWVFILRRGFREPQHIEVGFTTLTSPDWFVWVQIEDCHLRHFTHKYNLKEMEECVH